MREEYLQANISASYLFTNPNLAVYEVLLTPASSFGITSVKVEQLKGLSKIKDVTLPQGIVYIYTNIWVGAGELAGRDSIKDSTIRFKVEAKWLSDNKLENSSVRLIRWDKNKWTSLETAPELRDDKFIYYRAKTDAFSPFAIIAIPFHPSVTTGISETPALIVTPIKKIAEPITSEQMILNWAYIIIALIIGLFLYRILAAKMNKKIKEFHVKKNNSRK